jgi:hypothetical protein
MTENLSPLNLSPLAERVRAACIQAAVESYEDASAAGLCAQGAWEAAIGAMQSLDIGALIQEAQPQPGSGDQTSMRLPSGSWK